MKSSSRQRVKKTNNKAKSGKAVLASSLIRTPRPRPRGPFDFKRKEKKPPQPGAILTVTYFGKYCDETPD